MNDDIKEAVQRARKPHDDRIRAEHQKYLDEMYLPLNLRGTKPKRLVITGTTEDGRRVRATIEEIPDA